MLRALAIGTGALLLCAGSTLGYIASVALRRQEGVFLPAGCVAIGCLAAGAWLLRFGAR